MNSKDHLEFRRMKSDGATPETIFLAAENRHGSVEAIRILRTIFNLSLTAAKEVMVRAHGAASLDEHQKLLLPALKKTLENES
jgi:hypothetical protein